MSHELKTYLLKGINKKLGLPWLLVLLALLFSPFDGNPELIKLIVFALYALSIMVLLILSDRFSFMKSKLFQHLLIFIFLAGLSTALSTDIFISYWGDYTRHLGFFFWVCAFGFAVSVKHILKIPQDVQLILKVLMLSGLTASLAALILAIFGIGLFESRIGGTLGSPNILGKLLLVSLLSSIALYKDFKKHGLVLGFAAIFMVQWITFLFTGNRASWLAFLIGATFLLMPNFKDFVFQAKRNKTLLVFLGGIVLLSVPFLMTRFDDFTSVQTRSELYSQSLGLLSEKPWFGYGFDNLSGLIINTGDLSHSIDRVHQPFIDLSLMIGIPGALLFTAILILSFLSLYKHSKQTRVLAWIFLSLLISLQVSFLTIMSGVLVFLFIGLAMAAEESKIKPLIS